MRKAYRTGSKKKMKRNKEIKVPFNKKQQYDLKEFGDWKNLLKKGTYLISVVYDLPGRATSAQDCGRVFDHTHWQARINLFKTAAKKLSSINALAICLPGDFIGSPHKHNGLIPENAKANKKIIKNITGSTAYKALIKVWNNASQALIFGFGYNGSNEESDQLVCAVTSQGSLSVTRKWADLDKRIEAIDWPRQKQLKKKKLTFAVCYDLERVDWRNNKKKYKNSILVDCRHISVIGQQKEFERASEARKRTGGIGAGRTPKIMNERISSVGFSHIFVPVFRIKKILKNGWDPMSYFSWAAKRGLTRPTNYTPLASLKIEKRDRSECAYFNIFKL